MAALSRQSCPLRPTVTFNENPAASEGVETDPSQRYLRVWPCSLPRDIILATHHLITLTACSTRCFLGEEHVRGSTKVQQRCWESYTCCTCPECLADCFCLYGVQPLTRLKALRCANSAFCYKLLQHRANSSMLMILQLVDQRETCSSCKVPYSNIRAPAFRT